MGTVMRLLSKKRIDKGCYQHDYRYDADRYFHAMGCKAQQEGIRKAGTTPEAEHNDIQYQLTEMVSSVLDKQWQNGCQQDNSFPMMFLRENREELLFSEGLKLLLPFSESSVAKCALAYRSP